MGNHIVRLLLVKVINGSTQKWPHQARLKVLVHVVQFGNDNLALFVCHLLHGNVLQAKYRSAKVRPRESC